MATTQKHYLKINPYLDIISHNLHWAYGPNQKSIGGLLSRVEGVNQGFHTFALEWTPEKYAFFVDGYKSGIQFKLPKLVQLEIRRCLSNKNRPFVQAIGGYSLPG